MNRVGLVIKKTDGMKITYWCREDQVEGVKSWACDEYPGCTFDVVTA